MSAVVILSSCHTSNHCCVDTTTTKQSLPVYTEFHTKQDLMDAIAQVLPDDSANCSFSLTVACSPVVSASAAVVSLVSQQNGGSGNMDITTGATSPSVSLYLPFNTTYKQQHFSRNQSSGPIVGQVITVPEDSDIGDNDDQVSVLSMESSGEDYNDTGDCYEPSLTKNSATALLCEWQAVKQRKKYSPNSPLDHCTRPRRDSNISDTPPVRPKRSRSRDDLLQMMGLKPIA